MCDLGRLIERERLCPSRSFVGRRLIWYALCFFFFFVMMMFGLALNYAKCENGRFLHKFAERGAALLTQQLYMLGVQ